MCMFVHVQMHVCVVYTFVCAYTSVVGGCGWQQPGAKDIICSCEKGAKRKVFSYVCQSLLSHCLENVTAYYKYLWEMSKSLRWVSPGKLEQHKTLLGEESEPQVVNDVPDNHAHFPIPQKQWINVKLHHICLS